jgi:hypothetical protein
MRVQYLTGRRLLHELSYCNYTALTNGDGTSVNYIAGVSLLYLFLCTMLLFMLFTALCVPSGVLVTLTYLILFPMIFLWLAYGVSPLCWPMIPPRLPQDLAVELRALVPTSFEIPRFLVRDECTVRGRLSDGTLGGNTRCYKHCGEVPFQMLSWQDPLAWFMCELSTGVCLSAASLTSRWNALQDFTSSATYYADVVGFQKEDPDFVAAHRWCAFFKSYEICLACATAAFACLLLPYALAAIAEIFAAAMILLVQAYSVETVHDADDSIY